MSTTPNMGMLLPTVSSTPGPLYASENNQAFQVVDAHDHSSGNGVPVPSNGISINADLPFNNSNATLLRSTRYVNQVAPLALAADVGCIYIVAGNLYYNNGIGQPIQLTVGAALNAASIGGIGGDYATSTASEFYTSAQSKFTFWSAANTPASIDGGPLTIRNNTLNSFGVTISAFPTLSANYGLVLPAALPASTKILTVDASGNVGDVYDVDNSTLSISSNTLMVANQGITATQIANNTITSTQIAAHGIIQNNLEIRSTGITVGAGGVAISASSGVYVVPSNVYTQVTNLSVTITTTGRPVLLMLVPDGSGDTTPGLIRYGITAGNTDGELRIEIQRGVTPIADYRFDESFGVITPTAMIVPPSTVTFLDVVAAGTYTYNVMARQNAAPAEVDYCKLVAYEI